MRLLAVAFAKMAVAFTRELIHASNAALRLRYVAERLATDPAFVDVDAELDYWYPAASNR